MRSWVFGAVPLVLAALIAGEYLHAPAANSTQALLNGLAHDLKFTYHECVPLGWQPVPVRGTYYPGYTASMQNYAEWLDAIWRGHIEKSDLRNPQAADVVATLDHLAASGLLRKTNTQSRYDYYLTPRALAYYYGSSTFENNRDSLPYLCFSTIVPERIDWIAPASPPPYARRRHTQWYRLEFSWKPSSPPAWADAFIRAHSVVLAPLTSPTAAKVVFRDGQWDLMNIYDRGWMLPAIKSQDRPAQSVR